MTETDRPTDRVHRGVTLPIILINRPIITTEKFIYTQPVLFLPSSLSSCSFSSFPLYFSFSSFPLYLSFSSFPLYLSVLFLPFLFIFLFFFNLSSVSFCFSFKNDHTNTGLSNHIN